jgi:tRNA pseudouridine38-40 synthase
LAQRYFIQLSFKGTNFHGWQNQENAITVQGMLEKSLEVLLRKNIPITGAGRTDTGVHATYFMAHFDMEEDLIDTKKLIYQWNHILPNEIAIQSVFPVNSSAHARFSAISRTYEYRVLLSKDPFEHEYSLLLNQKPDILLLNEASKLLLEYTDFTSFCKLHSDNKTNICQIIETGWQKENNKLIFRIKANRFLRDMVRAIVGTMLDVGYNKINLLEFREIIEAKNRNKAGTSAPAHGLYLVNIEYPKDIFN